LKKLLVVLLLFMMVTGTFTGCKQASTDPGTTAAKFHIGIVTGTVSQSEDGYRGGEALAEEYGTAAAGGVIAAINWPDNFQSEQETTIANIVGLADDPLMKAIVVSDAVPGTAEAFKQVRAKRSDILLFAGKPMEDPGIIGPVCDVAALEPASELPALMAAILQPFLISDEACLRSFSGFEILSMYKILIFELVSVLKVSSKCSSTSSTPICALLPTDQILEKRSPFFIAASIIKTAVAPEPVIKSAPKGASEGIGSVNTPE